MVFYEDKSRDAAADQAGEWFTLNDAGLGTERDATALAAWLKRSPLHIEEFLGVSLVARDLCAARSDPAYSLEAILARARARAGDDSAVAVLSSHPGQAMRGVRSRRGLPVAAAVAACAVVGVALSLLWSAGFLARTVPGTVASLRLETKHGELLTHRFADDSVLHLNGDSAVTIRYGAHGRLAVLLAGEAEFDIKHDAARPFRVQAGSTEIVDVGTRFDVRLKPESTVVTVVEGRVAVSPLMTSTRIRHEPRETLQLDAGQQLTVSRDAWPAAPVTLDAQRATSWLRHEIAFDHEPLESVVAEYNRYTTRAIEIATPGLRSVQISGVFSTDDPEAFIAFLRSLKGVQVEVTEKLVRVSRR
jgi:transmembrane sensor